MDCRIIIQMHNAHSWPLNFLNYLLVKSPIARTPNSTHALNVGGDMLTYRDLTEEISNATTTC